MPLVNIDLAAVAFLMEIPSIVIDNTQEFEIDNYLNLHHKATGLYLMFHKTSFPDISFYLAQKYTQLPDQKYYQIYLSKRVGAMTVLDQNTYKSVDNRASFLSSVNQLVPETYDKVYELFNNFRKFQAFEAPEGLN